MMREVLEKSRHELSLLHEWLSGKQAVAVTDPSEAARELAQTYFDKGRRLMENI